MNKTISFVQLDGNPASAMVRHWGALITVFFLSMGSIPAAAQVVAIPEVKRTLNQWLTRMHEASRNRAYTGTLVVSTGEAMSASRIWHVCDGKQQMERIETLTGPHRTTVRHNNEVITFDSNEKVAWAEERESLGLFPELLRTPSNQIQMFYGVRERGAERVAGYLSDVVDIVPKDNMRFGYRIWSEQRSGLVLKLQTVDEKEHVMEQMAYTELQMNAPVRMEKLAKRMSDTRGYQVNRSVMIKTTPEKQGWRLKESIPGFLLVSCQSRAVAQSQRSAEPDSVQCVYSDGLASVSVFLEPQNAERPVDAAVAIVGATHSMNHQIGSYAVTVLGEVPQTTLVLFARSLERIR